MLYAGNFKFLLSNSSIRLSCSLQEINYCKIRHLRKRDSFLQAITAISECTSLRSSFSSLFYQWPKFCCEVVDSWYESQLLFTVAGSEVMTITMMMMMIIMTTHIAFVTSHEGGTPYNVHFSGSQGSWILYIDVPYFAGKKLLYSPVIVIRYITWDLEGVSAFTIWRLQETAPSVHYWQSLIEW